MSCFSLPIRAVLIALGMLAGGSTLQSQEPPTGSCTSMARFDFQPRASIAAGLTGTLELRPLGRDGAPLVLAAKVGSAVTVHLPCGSQWEATPSFHAIWGPRVAVTVGTAGGTPAIVIALWPLGRISGSVRLMEKGERLPKSLAVVTLAPRTPAQRELPKGYLDCPVDPRGRWECPPLPAAVFDLVLSSEGFIPQYRWELKVAAGKTTNVGTLDLKRGASVAGWVEVEGGRIDAACTARLVPAMAGGKGAQIAAKLARTAGEAHVRKDGFFQLAGVAPGSYSLEIRQPGFAAASVHPIEVWPRRETFLREPVTLKRPLRLELAISPPLDWLSHRWQVLVVRASEESGSFDREPVFQGGADEHGLLLIPDQTPGRFQVRISDSLENRLFSKIVPIDGPEGAHQDIQIDVLTVQGSLKLGKEPLAATLWFGGRYGGSSVRMESDADGKFQGVLPNDGWWRVDVSGGEPPFETRTKVQVEPDRLGRASVKIVLPTTRVFGKVLDDDSRAAPGTSVSFGTADGDVIVTSDDSGHFEARGLPEGPTVVAATLDSAQETSTSDRLSLLLHEGEDIGPIELRLRKNRKVSGTVRSTRGPVAGAGLVILPLQPTMMFGASARTDLDGTFASEVPASTLTAAVVVSPPGHALSAFAVDVGSAVPASLTVGDESGRLDLVLPEKPKGGGKEEMSLWVFQNSLPLPMDVLSRWIAGHGLEVSPEGKTLSIPDLAAGSYRACLTPRAAVAQWQASGFAANLARCAAGQLAAGGALRLDLSRSQDTK